MALEQGKSYPAGTTVRGFYKGTVYTLEAVKSKAEVVWQFVGLPKKDARVGKQYPSWSKAGDAVTGWGSVSPRFWTLAEEFDGKRTARAERKAAPKPKKEPKAKAKKAAPPKGVKTARTRKKVGGGNGANQERPYCGTCGEYFDTVEDASQHVLAAHPSEDGPSPEDMARSEAESKTPLAEQMESAGDAVEVA